MTLMIVQKPHFGPQIETSSEIRKNIKLGKKFDALVPSKIRHYINEHHLYRDIK